MTPARVPGSTLAVPAGGHSMGNTGPESSVPSASSGGGEAGLRPVGADAPGTRTVRDRVFDVLRRRGLTTIFANPGLDRGAVPRRAAGRPALRAGAARGLGRRARDRVRDRPRRAGARAPAHDGGARQRRRRARDRPRQPGAARRRRRPAGPAAPRVRAVPRPAGCTGSRASTRCGSTSRFARRTCRARSTRAYHEAATAARAGARGRADGRLAPAGGRGRARTPRRGRVVRAAGVDPAAVDELAGVPRGRDGAGARRRRRRRRPRTPGRRSSSWPSGSSRRCSRSRSRRAPASRRTTASSPASCRPTGRGCASGSAPYDAVLVVGAPVFRQSPYAPGPASPSRGRGSRSSATSRTRCTAAPPSWRCSRRRPPSRASSRVACRSATPRRRSPFAAAARAGAARAGRAADGEPRARGARRAAAPRTRSSSRRRPSTGPSFTSACSRASRSASSAPRWAGSASPSPAQRACAWRCRTARSSPSSATARRSTGSRALWSAVQRRRRRPRTSILSNGGYAIMDRLAERHGGDAPWPGLRRDRDRRGRARASAARRGGSRPTTSC